MEQLSSLQPLLTSPCCQHSNPPACHNTEIIPIPRAALLPSVSSEKLSWGYEWSCSHSVGRRRAKINQSPFPSAQRREAARLPGMGRIPPPSLGAGEKGLSSSPWRLNITPRTHKRGVMRGQTGLERRSTSGRPSCRGRRQSGARKKSHQFWFSEEKNASTTPEKETVPDPTVLFQSRSSARTPSSNSLHLVYLGINLWC